MLQKEKTSKNKGLGRGLSALMGGVEKEYSDISGPAPRELPVEFLKPSPYQPRLFFDEEKAKELVASIREKGVLQPILVRKVGGVEDYEIIAGERRWRASQAAGLHVVPVHIRQMSDEEALEVALIENIQRQDLNAVEEAQGFKRLMDEFHHTQEQLGRVVGKSRSHVANMLRLLTLPQAVQKMVSKDLLSMGHARALVSAEDPVNLAKRIIKDGLSVRKTETLAKRIAEGVEPKEKSSKPGKVKKLLKDADTIALENDLAGSLGLKVTVDFNNDESGEIRIHYKTLEQLDDICQRLCDSKV